ncbi:MAG: nickel pincer cofactor biosynthesis protein LarC [Candidatus Methylacidiphilales bacterium]
MLLYIDASLSGISGDMFIGACLDLGLDAAQLETELKKLPLTEHWCLTSHRDQRGSISGIKADFAENPHHHHHEHDHHSHSPHHHPSAHSHHHGRHYSDILKLIQSSTLNDSVKHRASAIFERLGRAEAAIHGVTLESVHFHEVGALDSILDIVGASVALDLLGVTTVHAAVPVDGCGHIHCDHGRFPVPAPATLELLRGLPFQQIDVPHELITPTGAALLSHCVSAFQPLVTSRIHRVGYGLGQREMPGHPNVLRLILAEDTTSSSSLESDNVQMIESNVDDVTGERLGAIATHLMSLGALDVAILPILMKKGRPGHQIQVMCHADLLPKLTEIFFTWTGSLGVRIQSVQRLKLYRTIKTVDTPYGPIRIKCSGSPDLPSSLKAESDDVHQAAEKHGVPPDTVIHSAVSLWKSNS